MITGRNFLSGKLQPLPCGGWGVLGHHLPNLNRILRSRNRNRTEPNRIMKKITEAETEPNLQNVTEPNLCRMHGCESLLNSVNRLNQA